MLKIIRVITAFILVLILGFVIYKFNVFRFIETREYTTNFSQFVSLKSLDEYVVAELRTNESFHRESEKILWQGIPLGRAVADISLIASFKYFVKLRELKYEMQGDTLVVNAPSLYVSTPVPYDSATVKNNCNASTPLVDCKPTINILMSEVTGKLAEKGKAQMALVFDKAAKALADNLDVLAKNNEKVIFYKNIAVVFANEVGQSQRMFNYNKSLCGEGPCKLEIPFGNDRFLTIP
jgi:hypothetical protein